jgi:hypothetical protein
LIGASLVGIPWAVLREAFVRKLMYVMIQQAKRVGSASIKQWIERIYNVIAK